MYNKNKNKGLLMKSCKAFYTDSNGIDTESEVFYSAKKSGGGFNVILDGCGVEKSLKAKTFKVKTRYTADKLAFELATAVTAILEGIEKPQYVLYMVVKEDGKSIQCPILVSHFHCVSDSRKAIIDYIASNTDKEIKMLSGEFKLSIRKLEEYRGDLENDDKTHGFLKEFILE